MEYQNYSADSEAGPSGPINQPQPIPTPSQPAATLPPLLSIGDLFRRSFVYLKQNTGRLVGIMAIPLGLSWLFSLVLPEHGMLTSLSNIIVNLLSLLASLAIILAIKNNSNILNSYTSALRICFGGIWVSLLFGLIVTGGTMLLVIPGIIFSIWFAFALFVFVLEEKKGLGALLTSKSYVKGYFWPVLARFFIMGVVIFLIPGFIMAGIYSLLPLAFEDGVAALGTVLAAILTGMMLVAVLFLGPFILVYTYHLYSDLVRVKPTIASAPIDQRGKGFLVFVAILGTLLPIIVAIVFGLVMGNLAASILRNQPESPVMLEGEINPVPIPKSISNEPICDSIANDEALRSLPDALMLLFVPSRESEARSVVRQAITSLDRLSQDADDELSYELINTAHTLDILLSTQSPTEEMVSNAVDALDGLGDEVQALCGFF